MEIINTITRIFQWSFRCAGMHKYILLKWKYTFNYCIKDFIASVQHRLYVKEHKNLEYYWVFCLIFFIHVIWTIFTYLHSYFLNFWLLHQCVSLSNLSFIMEAKLDIGLDTFSLRIFEWKFNVEDYIYKLTMFPKYYILCNTQTKWY